MYWDKACAPYRLRVWPHVNNDDGNSVKISDNFIFAKGREKGPNLQVILHSTYAEHRFE